MMQISFTKQTERRIQQKWSEIMQTQYQQDDPTENV